jgi:hypothetical protein
MRMQRRRGALHPEEASEVVHHSTGGKLMVDGISPLGAAMLIRAACNSRSLSPPGPYSHPTQLHRRKPYAAIFLHHLIYFGDAVPCCCCYPEHRG